MSDQEYVAKFSVFKMWDTGELTFLWGRNREYFGTIHGPGTVSVSVFPPERLMVAALPGQHKHHIGLPVATAVEAAQMERYGLTWEPKSEAAT